MGPNGQEHDRGRGAHDERKSDTESADFVGGDHSGFTRYYMFAEDGTPLATASQSVIVRCWKNA